MDKATQEKWDRCAPSFDIMSANGPEKRWKPNKLEFFARMRPDAKILFLALGTGLDIPTFPPGRTITAIDISPAMLEYAQQRIADYDGEITAEVMDVHNMGFADESFDQIFTSCTFCSVPNPVAGLEQLKRVLKLGGELHMFEHTGSRWFPFSIMMQGMSRITRRFGPELDRDTVSNVSAAGFELTAVDHIYLDTVKTIHAIKPAD